MWATIFAAFQAIPEIAKELKAMREMYYKIKQENIEKQLSDLKSEVREVIGEIKKATTNEERLKLAHRLASAANK